MRRKRFLSTFALILLPALFFMTGMGTSPQEIGEIGAKVEEFSLTTFDGKTVTHEDLDKKVTLIVFWFPT
ncbi:TlpA family protein disulfide reductase [Candidatus Zixiibacteriota bacterium]